MSYPAAVATGNNVLRAALELEAAEANGHGAVTLAGSQRIEAARARLRAATRAYRAASAAPHEQGPDLDGDPIIAETHDGTRWVAS